MRNEAGIGRFVPSRADAAVIGFVVLLYVEHLIYGANRADLALFFAIAHLLILLGVLAFPAARRALSAAPLGWLAALLALVLAEAVFSVIPFGGRIGHPLWTYVSPAGGSVSLDPAASRVEIIKLLGVAAMFLLGTVVGARRERADVFVNALAYVGSAYAVWAFLSWSANPRVIFGVPRPYGATRLGASFLSSNSAGTLFACQVVLLVCMVLRSVRRAQGPLFSVHTIKKMKGAPTALILLFISASCLLLTESRGALLACAASVALLLAGFAFIRSDERSAAGGLGIVAGLLAFTGLVLLIVSGGPILARFGSDNPLSNTRMAIFAGYWRSMLASPWWGYGAGAFHAVNFQSMDASNALAMGALGAAHNVYIQWLLQAGLLGFLPMMALMAVILVTIAGGLRRRARQQALLIMVLAIAAVFAVHGAVDYGLEEPSLAAFFGALLGLGYGVATRR